ncbi:GNAT family N-acetyltransferase [Jejuia pallidilutea]|nr:GNAT family N-acetyltransferase [Jejuia pallidilutea]GAL90541.1 GCN5-related N-acetyltransferase [Jejuia pallidilutea]
MIEFIKATTTEQCKTTALLANNIWREHYTKIIGKAQVDFMLEKFQSANAIKQQIAEGYMYYIITVEATAIGYISIKKEDKNLFLSKFYVIKPERGKGFGKTAMTFLETKAKALNCNSISLTVNKNNGNAINAYEKLGFNNVGTIVIDIGKGFVMDDYKMCKELT